MKRTKQVEENFVEVIERLTTQKMVTWIKTSGVMQATLVIELVDAENNKEETRRELRVYDLNSEDGTGLSFPLHDVAFCNQYEELYTEVETA